VQGLESLLLLNLSHNSLSSDFLSQQTFATQLKLVALDLSYNALKTIKVTKKTPKIASRFLRIHDILVWIRIRGLFL
jgi:hypothetical protein